MDRWNERVMFSSMEGQNRVAFNEGRFWDARSSLGNTGHLAISLVDSFINNLRPNKTVDEKAHPHVDCDGLSILDSLLVH